MSIIFSPQEYKIPAMPETNFIDHDEINNFLQQTQNPSNSSVEEVISIALNKQRLSLHQTAILLNANAPEQVDLIKYAASQLKEQVYGKRIVLFAPLYIGNYCTNSCVYCGFRADNKAQKRTTLNTTEIEKEVKALEDVGHKRLILVYGEHPKYNAQFIADTVRTTYNVKSGNGEIRRVNINAAPLDIEGFRTVKQAGIGTFQIFQETYHKETYSKVHPHGSKSNYEWRITAFDRAMQAGIDDVGIGALLGLYDWRYEILALVRHTNHLEAVYNVGPHTISFPRIQDASNINVDSKWKVSDHDFTKLVAILRLAVPYAGLILTAREPVHIRNEVLQYGVSQIDGGTNIELKGYSNAHKHTDANKEQFEINDKRSLSEIINNLVENNYLPSFCTACYRLNRTGEHFMEFSVPGFIKQFCQPNAILTLAEYLEDYATPVNKQHAYRLIEQEINSLSNFSLKQQLIERLKLIKEGKRDLYF